MLTRANLAQLEDSESSSASVYTSSDDDAGQDGLGDSHHHRKNNADDADSIDANYDSDDERLNRILPESFIKQKKGQPAGDSGDGKQRRSNNTAGTLSVQKKSQPQGDGEKQVGTAARRKTFYEPMDDELEIEEVADTWYFAYGSNMNIAQLLSRIGNFEKKKLMALEGYDLRFNKKMSLKRSANATIQKCAFANVVQCPGETVFGISYLVCKRQLELMDNFEGTKSGHYNREMMMCLDCETKKLVECAVYIAPSEACGDGLLPTDSYLSNLLGGRSMLPEYYAKRLVEQECIPSKDLYNAIF